MPTPLTPMKVAILLGIISVFGFAIVRPDIAIRFTRFEGLPTAFVWIWVIRIISLIFIALLSFILFQA